MRMFRWWTAERRFTGVQTARYSEMAGHLASAFALDALPEPSNRHSAGIRQMGGPVLALPSRSGTRRVPF